MKKNLENCSSELLAVNVIAFRLFGWNKQDAESSMKILQQRKISGDSFEFENFIENEVKKANEKSKTYT